MSDMLLDTSGLLCCLDAAEVRHQDAISFFEAAFLKITHNYVLVEFVALAHARKYPRHLALSFIMDVAAHPDVDVVWIDEKRHGGHLRSCASSLTSRIRSAMQSASS